MSYDGKDASTNRRRVSLTAEQGANTVVTEECEDLHNSNSSFISEMLSISDNHTRKAIRAANSWISRPAQPTYHTDDRSKSNPFNEQQGLDPPAPLNPSPVSAVSAQTISSLERQNVLGNRGFASGPQSMIPQATYNTTTFSDSSSADNPGYISGPNRFSRQRPSDRQGSFSSNNYPLLNDGSAYFNDNDTATSYPQAFNSFNAQNPRHQQSHGGRYKTAPEEAWDTHERRQSQQFRLGMSELEVGLIVYNSPNGTWAGGHNVLVLGWEDPDHVDFLETTTFTNRRITEVFRDENDDRRQDFLLFTDSRMAPHSGLPTVDLEGGRAMPRVSYIKFRIKRTGKMSNFRRYGDSKSLENRYVVTREGMDIVRDYLIKREGRMKECEATEKREQEEKEVKAQESAKALEEQQKKAVEAAEKAEAERLAAEEESRRIAEEEKKAMEETKKRKAEEMKRAVLEQMAAMKVDRA